GGGAKISRGVHPHLDEGRPRASGPCAQGGGPPRGARLSGALLREHRRRPLRRGESQGDGEAHGARVDVSHAEVEGREAADTVSISGGVTSRPALVRRGLALNYLTIGYNVLEAVVADAMQTSLCAYLSVIALAGVALNTALGWWWADPVAALLMVPIIAKEGVEGVRGEAHCEDDCC